MTAHLLLLELPLNVKLQALAMYFPRLGVEYEKRRVTSFMKQVNQLVNEGSFHISYLVVQQ